MNYAEALQTLFKKYGKKETCIWLDCNNPSKDEVIRYAMFN